MKRDCTNDAGRPALAGVCCNACQILGHSGSSVSMSPQHHQRSEMERGWTHAVGLGYVRCSHDLIKTVHWPQCIVHCHLLPFASACFSGLPVL